MTVWTVERKVKVKVGTETLEYDSVSAEDVKKIAKERGIRKFIIEDENGNLLSIDDFPVLAGWHYASRDKNLIIKEHNKNDNIAVWTAAEGENE